MRGQVFIAASALMGAMLIAQPAAAQQYRNYQDEHLARQEQCERQQQRRQIGGAIIGGIAGALLGREVADRGVRGEGAAVGAVAGAVVGAGVGRSTANCDQRVQGRYDQYGRPYDRGYDDGYGRDNSGLYGGRDDGYRNAGYRRGQQCRPDEIVVRDRRGRERVEEVMMCRGRDGVWRPQEY